MNRFAKLPEGLQGYHCIILFLFVRFFYHHAILKIQATLLMYLSQLEPFAPTQTLGC